jgi:hypothetical protein
MNKTSNPMPVFAPFGRLAVLDKAAQYRFGSVIRIQPFVQNV